MKKKISCIIYFVFIFFMLTACQRDETVENLEIQNLSEACEIIESSDPTCEKPVESGIYTEYKQWERAINGTDISVILEKKDMYDEKFFEDKALIYIADCSSGNSQCEYEGYAIEEVNGKTNIYIKMSYSTDMLLNKLHAYHVFFILDRQEAEKIEEAKLSVFERD